MQYLAIAFSGYYSGSSVLIYTNDLFGASDIGMVTKSLLEDLFLLCDV